MRPSLTLQCWGFMVGSALFGFGSLPVISEAIGSTASNVAFFTGSLFFTAAGLVELRLAVLSEKKGDVRTALLLAASVQSIGTVLFNISTFSALYASTFAEKQSLSWGPDAEGSAAFLISGALELLYLARADRLWRPRDEVWWSSWANMAGCIAFAAAAVASQLMHGGATRNPALASWGTFVGALCFFAASAFVLPSGDHGLRRRPHFWQ